MLEKIKNLCKVKKITLSQLEADLGFGSGCISKLNKSNPSIRNIEKIADYLDVTVEYLLNQDIENSEKDTCERYSVLRNKKGYTDYQVCKLANIQSSTISTWKTKRYEPKITTLRKIAEVLGCDVADFYERNVGKYEEADVFIPSIKELKNKFNNVVLEIGNIDIETMKKLVEISDIIEKLECDMTKKGEE